MWFAHFVVPMIVYYVLFPHFNAYLLLIGAFFANTDAIIVKLKLKNSEFHLNSFFHSIPFGLCFSLIFLPFGTKDVISFAVGHLIHLLLDSGSDGGVTFFYPLRYKMNMRLWKNTFHLGFKNDYLSYFSTNYLLEILLFLVLLIVLPSEFLTLFGSSPLLSILLVISSLVIFVQSDVFHPKIVNLIVFFSLCVFIFINTKITGLLVLLALFNLFMMIIYASVKNDRNFSSILFLFLTISFSFFFVILIQEDKLDTIPTVIAFLLMMSSIFFVWLRGFLHKYEKNAPIGI